MFVDLATREGGSRIGWTLRELHVLRVSPSGFLLVNTLAGNEADVETFQRTVVDETFCFGEEGTCRWKDSWGGEVGIQLKSLLTTLLSSITSCFAADSKLLQNTAGFYLTTCVPTP